MYSMRYEGLQKNVSFFDGLTILIKVYLNGFLFSQTRYQQTPEEEKQRIADSTSFLEGFSVKELKDLQQTSSFLGDISALVSNSQSRQRHGIMSHRPSAIEVPQLIIAFSFTDHVHYDHRFRYKIHRWGRSGLGLTTLSRQPP